MEEVKKEGKDISSPKKKKSNHVWLTYLICLVLAVMVWLAVMWFHPPKTEVVFHDVPVQLVGTAELDAAGYACQADAVIKSVTLSGTRMELSKARGELVAVVDLSSLSQRSGTFTLPVYLSSPGEVETTQDVTLTVTVYAKTE